MNVKHRRYLRTYKNEKQGVNAINFVWKLESVYFDRSWQNRAFDIWNTPNANWLQDSVIGEYCRNGSWVTYFGRANIKKIYILTS